MDNERAIREHDRLQTANQPHRRGVQEEHRMYPEAGSELGRLALNGVINKREFQAGEEYLRRYGEYRSLGGGPRGLSNGGGGGFDCNPEVCDPKDCRCVKVKQAFRELDYALREGDYHASRTVVWAVQWTVLHDRPLIDYEWRFLRMGLGRMATYLRLTKS